MRENKRQAENHLNDFGLSFLTIFSQYKTKLVDCFSD